MKERSLSEKVTGIQRMSDSSQVTKGTEYIVGRGNNMSQGLGPHKLLMKQCFDIKLYVLFSLFLSVLLTTSSSKIQGFPSELASS
jgi:hypothetical protein